LVFYHTFVEIWFEDGNGILVRKKEVVLNSNKSLGKALAYVYTAMKTEFYRPIKLRNACFGCREKPNRILSIGIECEFELWAILNGINPSGDHTVQGYPKTK